MLEPLREYAASCLAPAAAEAVRRAHAAWCLGWVESVDPEGPWDATSMRRLDTEAENARAPLTWTLDDDPEFALRLGLGLSRYWLTRGLWTEGRAALQRALERGATAPAPLRLRAVRWAAWFAFRLGEHEKARRMLRAGLEESREEDDAGDIAAALHDLACVARSEGDCVTALPLEEEALGLLRSCPPSSSLFMSLTHRGMIALMAGDAALARTSLEEALAGYRSTGNERGVAEVLTDLAAVSCWEGDLDQAERQGHRALTLARSLADEGRTATILAVLGGIALARGDAAAARAHFDEALERQRHLGDRVGTVTSLLGLARAACGLGDLPAARAGISDALLLALDLGEQRALCTAIDGVAELLARVEGTPDIRAAPGQDQFCVSLAAAADAHRSRLGLRTPPADEHRRDQHLAALRERLGDEAYRSAWEAGRGMSLPAAAGHAQEALLG